ncbi:MAG TPA: hypothetical protein DDZ41_01065, partial [Flavobacterium sp.]|nr:hypothetical protein [Flavobacterium sp.]
MLVRKTYLIITIVWLVILTILSFLDFSNQDILAPKNSDKVVHFLLYFTLTIVAVKSVKSLPYKYFIIPFSCFLYGTLIEIFL